MLKRLGLEALLRNYERIVAIVRPRVLAESGMDLGAFEIKTPDLSGSFPSWRRLNASQYETLAPDITHFIDFINVGDCTGSSCSRTQ